MRRSNGRDARLTGGLAALFAASLLLSGCGNKDVFCKIDGQTITKDEYIHALEETNVAAQGGQTNAERAVIDQLITNKVILSEAAKENVVPSDEAVNQAYNYQIKLFQEQMPQGKDYDAIQRDQGTTPDETKKNIKVHLAEMALYAKKLNITDSDIRKVYDKANGQFGLPARVLMRLIIVAPNSPDFAHVKQLLDAHTDFATVAKQINIPALRGSGGMLPQFEPITQIAPPLNQLIVKSSVGDILGPVDYKISQNQPPVKAWAKVEDKRPPYNIQFEDAAPLIRQQMVQVQIVQPQNAAIRNQIIQEKLGISFEPTESSYKTVWDAIKKSAQAAGIGQAPVGAPTTSLTSGGGAASVPAAAPAAKP